MDLNVSIDTKAAMQTARLLGFNVIALNKNVLATADLRGHRSKFETTDFPGLRILRRLTISVNQPAQLAQLSKLDISSMGYDLFAIRPMNDSVLKSLIESPLHNLDIMSLDLTQPILTSSMRPALAKVISSGVQIEVEFSSCLKDSSGRVQCINQCRNVLATFKSGVFISSGAKNVLEMRSNTDLTNFAMHVLGLRDCLPTLKTRPVQQIDD